MIMANLPYLVKLSMRPMPLVERKIVKVSFIHRRFWGSLIEGRKGAVFPFPAYKGQARSEEAVKDGDVGATA